MSKEIGQRLREWRKLRRLTQDEVASMVGVKRGGYASWESGTQPIPAHRLEMLQRMGFGVVEGQRVRLPDDVGGPMIAASQLEIPIRYIGVISASTKMSWTDPFLEVDAMEFVPPEMGDPKGRYCCRVVTDSMMPLIQPDDLCVFHYSD